MEEVHDDRFVVYVRSRRDAHDPPEDSEWPVVSCSTYEEACRIRDAQRLRAAIVSFASSVLPAAAS